MITSRHLLTLVLAGLLAPVVHCTSSTALVSSWHDSSYRSGSLRRPLVVAVADKHLVRVKLEDQLARGLRGAGIDAVASYTMFPQKELLAETIKDRLPSTDRDSVMITHLVDVKVENVVVSGDTEVYPMAAADYPRYGTWGTYYTYSYGVVTSPSYTFETKKYVLQTKLYDAATEKPVWTATTQSEEPTSLDSAIDAFVGVIVKDVQQNRLF